MLIGRFSMPQLSIEKFVRSFITHQTVGKTTNVPSVSMDRKRNKIKDDIKIAKITLEIGLFLLLTIIISMIL